MSKIKNRADLLIAAGESIKMQAAHGIEPVCKSREFVGGKKTESKIANCLFAKGTWENSDYEFPIAVLEGKAVFNGDELYNTITGQKFKAHDEYTSCLDCCSWNPPKPKTVMVELLVDDAQGLILPLSQDAMAWHIRLSNACSKAVGELK